MPLRSANNPNTDQVVLAAMAQVMVGAPQNTVLALGSIFIMLESALSQQGTVYPAALLWPGNQLYECRGFSHYDGTLDCTVEYYDRWDQQPSTIDQVTRNIAADLERVKANLEDNVQLAVGGIAHTVSIPRMRLSHYKGERTLDPTVPGMILVKRTLTVTVNILPYDVQVE